MWNGIMKYIYLIYHSDIPKQKSEVHTNSLLLQLRFLKHSWNHNSWKIEILKVFIPTTDNLKQNILIKSNSSKGTLFNKVWLEIALAKDYAKFRNHANRNCSVQQSLSSSEVASMKIESLQYQTE